MYTTPKIENPFDKYDEPRLHIERLMKVRLIEFDLSIRILLMLEKADIHTLGDLCNQTKESLQQIRNIGCASIDAIESILHRLGLSLRE